MISCMNDIMYDNLSCDICRIDRVGGCSCLGKDSSSYATIQLFSTKVVRLAFRVLEFTFMLLMFLFFKLCSEFVVDGANICKGVLYSSPAPAVVRQFGREGEGTLVNSFKLKL